MRKALVLLGVCWVVSAFPEAADAQGMRRAAVRSFGRGGAANAARQAVTNGIGDLVTVVPTSEVETAERTAEDDVRQLARALRVELVISGEVQGRGRRATTQLRIVDSSGTQLASANGPAPSGRGNGARLGEAAATAVRQALATLDQRVAVQNDTAHLDDERPPGSQPTASGEESGADGDGDDVGDEGGADSGDGVVHPPMLRALVGFGLRTRRASVDLEGAASRDYKAPGYGELAVRLELRPFASASGGTRGLFAYGDFSMAIGLKSNVVAGTGDVDTTSMRIGGGVGYALALAHDRVHLGATVGGGLDTFKLGANVVLPSTSYAYLRPAVIASFGLVDQVLRLDVDAGVRIVLGVGDIEKAFGTSASAFGFDAGLGLGGAISLFTYGVRFGYTRYSLSFSGAGSEGHSTGGSDASINVTALVGVQL